MSTKITNRGYEVKKNIMTDSQIKKIKKNLLIKPKGAEEFGEETEPYEAYTETKHRFIIPRYYGVKLFGEAEKITIHPTMTSFDFKNELRPHQHAIVGQCIRELFLNHGTIMSVPCGVGKTIMAIFIAHMLGLKTMVLVHKSFLLDQWTDRIKSFTNATVGYIRQNNIDVKDKDFVIAMIQSVSMREYDPSIFENIGLLIVDEAHHIVAKVFSRSLSKVGSIYTLGLTATPYRADGLTKLLYWYLGPHMYREERKVTCKVLVNTFEFQSTHKLFAEKTRWIKGKYQPMCPIMITNLCDIPRRNKIIIDMLDELRKTTDRKILLLSGRIEHLEYLKKITDEHIENDVNNGLLEKGEYKTYYYIGRMKRSERQEAEKNGDILFGTYELAQEGLDIDRLNTIILATPKKNVVQAIGRIMRKILTKTDLNPLIIDVLDNLSVFRNQGRLRKKMYKQNEYIIDEYMADDKCLVIKRKYSTLSPENNIKNTLDMKYIFDKSNEPIDDTVCSKTKNIIDDNVDEVDDQVFNPNICVI